MNLKQIAVRYQTQLNPLQFAYSAIIHGLGYISTSLCFLENGILPPSHLTFYNQIDKVIDAVIEIARNNAFEEYLKMSPNTIISLDGSWDHRRSGRCCIVVIINQNTKKIIDFQILRRSSKVNPTDYNGSPQGMETECVRRISRRLKNNVRIVGYVHDRDRSVTAFMKKNWNIDEYIDRNHSIKTLATLFSDVEKVCGKQDQIFVHLFNFMNFLISLPTNKEAKIKEWKNAANHYCGHH